MKTIYAVETTRGLIYTTFKPVLTDNFYTVVPGKNDEEYEEAWRTNSNTVYFQYSKYYSKCQIDCLRKNFFRKINKKPIKLEYLIMPFDIFKSLKIDNDLLQLIENRMYEWTKEDMIYGEWTLGKRPYNRFKEKYKEKKKWRTN